MYGKTNERREGGGGVLECSIQTRRADLCSANKYNNHEIKTLKREGIPANSETEKEKKKTNEKER